jgi:acyl-CoA hydrolase
MEVGVKVWVENLRTGEIKHTSSAYLTFVALDNTGNRVTVPPVVAETEEDARRWQQAADRRAYRLALKATTRSKN